MHSHVHISCLRTYLAGNTGWGEPLVLAVFIKEPAHHAAACADLWARYVNVWAHHGPCMLQAYSPLQQCNTSDNVKVCNVPAVSLHHIML